jgi:hypothetical protein
MNATPKLSLVADRDRALNALLVSPSARKAQADHAALLLKQRSDLVAEMSKLDEAAARDLPKLRGDVDAATAEFKEAQSSFYGGFYNPNTRASASAAGILAQGKFAAAQHKIVVASFGYSARRDRIEHELRCTASPSVALFISEMRDLWRATRSTSAETLSHLVRNPITDRTSEAIASNAASISARMKAIREAIAAAEEIALEPDQANVDTRLEKLRQALPAIGRPEFRK